MNILRVIHSMDPVNGGPCQGLRNMIPELEKLGCLNEVVCLDDPSAPFLGGDPFPVHALGKGRGPLRYHPALVSWLRTNAGRFEAFIVHGLWLWPSLAARLSLACSGVVKKPYFVMPHGMLDPWFQQDPKRGVRRVRNSLYWHLAERGVVNGAAGVLFTTREEMMRARTSFHGYAPKREIEIGYGLPRPPGDRAPMVMRFRESVSDLKDAPYLLFLGRLDEKKGLDLLLWGYHAFAREHLESCVGAHAFPHLVIAGPGMETPYGKYLQKTVPRQIAPLIHFTGMLRGDDKWGALGGCDALIHPSHQENFGISVAEALGCGRPVLISDKVNIHAAVREARAGLVAPDDLGGLRDLLTGWMTLSPVQRAAMGEAAERLFLREYGAVEAAGRIVSILSPLIRI
jgi:glycosyltransferase involved in cell wall biosynthesis